jgi:rod shape-determining protein MreC
VRVGDELVTSGLGEIFPQGLLLGTVLRISPQGSGLFQDIEAHPAVNFNQIEEVLVILTSKFQED